MTFFPRAGSGGPGQAGRPKKGLVLVQKVAHMLGGRQSSMLKATTLPRAGVTS